MNLRPLALLLPIILAACASPTKQLTADASEQQCVRELPIGSNIPVTRCRTAAETEEERQAAKKLRQSAPSTVNSRDAGL